MRTVHLLVLASLMSVLAVGSAAVSAPPSSTTIESCAALLANCPCQTMRLLINLKKAPLLLSAPANWSANTTANFSLNPDCSPAALTRRPLAAG